MDQPYSQLSLSPSRLMLSFVEYIALELQQKKSNKPINVVPSDIIIGNVSAVPIPIVTAPLSSIGLSEYFSENDLSKIEPEQGKQTTNLREITKDDKAQEDDDDNTKTLYESNLFFENLNGLDFDDENDFDQDDDSEDSSMSGVFQFLSFRKSNNSRYDMTDDEQGRLHNPYDERHYFFDPAFGSLHSL